MLDYQRLSEASRIFKFKNGGTRPSSTSIHKIANEAWIIKESQVICTKRIAKCCDNITHTSCNPLNHSLAKSCDPSSVTLCCTSRIK